MDCKPKGHEVGRCNKGGACIACTSVGEVSSHKHRMDGLPLPSKIDIPCYQRQRVGGREKGVVKVVIRDNYTE